MLWFVVSGKIYDSVLSNEKVGNKCWGFCWRNTASLVVLCYVVLGIILGVSFFRRSAEMMIWQIAATSIVLLAVFAGACAISRWLWSAFSKKRD